MNNIKESTYKFIDENKKDLKVNLFTGTIESHKEKPDKDGYLWISLNGKTIRSHHIIGYYIFGQRMIGYQLNHIDGIKNNNSPVNLEICTPSENVRHAFETGLKKATRGTESTSSKITEKDVIMIRELRKQGKTLKSIGDIYSLSFQQVSRICSGERWGHVPLHWDENLADMDFTKYSEQALRTSNKELNNFDEISNYALGLVSESAEVTDQVKKELFHGHDINPGKIKDELGDVLWYMTNLAGLYGITLKEIAVNNIEKLSARYPNGFSEKNSKNRVV